MKSNKNVYKSTFAWDYVRFNGQKSYIVHRRYHLMNPIFFQRLSFWLGLTIITILESGLSAQAETIAPDSTDASVKFSFMSPTQIDTPLLVENSHPMQATGSSTLVPVPGTTVTSAAALAPYFAESAPTYPSPAPAAPTYPPPTPSAPAATETVSAARPLSNYIGIGGDIGLSGRRTSLGGGGFAILSRTRLTKLGNSFDLSLRGATVVFGHRTATSMFALTVGTPIKNKSSGRVVAVPFLGGGVLLRKTGGNTKADPLLSVGVDVPISRQFTATVRVNVGFLNEQTQAGLLVGIGYNFNLFGRK